MATYTLIPSSLTGGASIANVSRAYTNTSSTTYATAQLDSSNRTAWLGGFNFGSIPDETIVSVTIKCKVKNQYECFARVYSSSDSERVALSALAYVRNLSSDGLITFSLTSNTDTIISYLASGTLCIAIYISSSSTNGSEAQIYGAEVIVETDATPKPNKIIYGGNTILDLTEDTVTRAKVLSGTTFHLPSGVQSVGTLPPPISPSMKTKTASPTSSTKISFTGLESEPTSFVVIHTDAISGAAVSNYFITHIWFDGSYIQLVYISITSSTKASRVFVGSSSAIYPSFTYSSGTLTITVTSGSGSQKFATTTDTYTLFYI